VEDKSIDSNYCEFYFGNRIAPGGYIWVFPKGDNLANVGIGIVGSKSEPGLPTKLITNFVQERFPKGKAVEMVVGGAPVAGVMETTTADGVMLVGDAAHHTDALTGGGILNAMRAGVIAGKVAAKAIAAGDVTKAGLKEYEDRWRAAISMNLERSYEYKEFLLKLTDEDLNKLLGPLAAEDISKMDLRGMIRLMFKLNPKLLWELRQLVV
jgi:digeranylgeranylglycerophospholipid reductase